MFNETTQKEVPHISNRHPITSALINALKDGKPGDELTEEQLKDACGFPVNIGSHHYGKLLSAIRYCINNHGRVWERQYNQHKIRCMNGEEVVVNSSRDTTAIRRRANRAKKKLYTVKLPDLTPEMQKQHVTAVAQLSAIHMFSGKKAHDNLIEQGKTELPKLEDLTKLFK